MRNRQNAHGRADGRHLEIRVRAPPVLLWMSLAKGIRRHASPHGDHTLTGQSQMTLRATHCPCLKAPLLSTLAGILSASSWTIAFLAPLRRVCNKQSSASLLSGSSFVTCDTMPSMASSTLTKSSKTPSGTKWPSPKWSHKEKGSSLRQSPYLPMRSSRNSLGRTKTPIPVPVPVLPKRCCSQDGTETFEVMDGTEARYEPLSLVCNPLLRLHICRVNLDN